MSERQTDRQTKDRQTDKQTNRQKERELYLLSATFDQAVARRKQHMAIMAVWVYGIHKPQVNLLVHSRLAFLYRSLYYFQILSFRAE